MILRSEGNKAWSNKLPETGSLFDRPRSGRPTEREMRLMMWRKMSTMVRKVQ